MRVSNLWIYPLKSAAGVSLERAQIGARGFRYDRRWMLVDPDGEFLTQREHPEIALLSPQITSDKLVLTRPDGAFIEVPLEPSEADPVRVRVWRSRCEALGVSRAADAWLADFLGAECRLVYMPESTRRRVNPKYGGEDDIVSFADGYPFLLIGEASLADLNGRLSEPVSMRRFRPNIVVDTDEPFCEDNWRRFRIGEVAFRVAKPCARCTITTIDQSTAARGKEPLATLSSYRKVDGKVLFGQNLIHEGRGEICVGDAVEVSSELG